MRILAIETSCDETALSITEQDATKGASSPIVVLGNQILSQIDIHKEYGGVFPAIAKREHAKALVPLFLTTLQEAGVLPAHSSCIKNEHDADLTVLLEREPELLSAVKEYLYCIDRPDIDAIALTVGPGLEPALWVGINFAKTLSLLFNIPILPVNHMEGHLLAAAVSSVEDEHDKKKLVLHDIQYPALGLLVSGGHTELIKINAFGSYELVGETLDDAVGEAFDKVARLIGLPYPGGPEISKLARLGTPGAIKLPRPMLHSGDYNFSFSGLKTAVRYFIEKLPELTDEMKCDIARDFEDACLEVLITKTTRAVQEFGIQTVILGGGVSANGQLRERLKNALSELQCALLVPGKGLSTDNALMIALAAHIRPRNPLSAGYIRARGQFRIHE